MQRTRRLVVEQSQPSTTAHTFVSLRSLPILPGLQVYAGFNMQSPVEPALTNAAGHSWEPGSPSPFQLL